MKKKDKSRQEERQRQLEKGAQSVILPQLGVKRRWVGKKKRKSTAYQRKVLSFPGQLSVLLWD